MKLSFPWGTTGPFPLPCPAWPLCLWSWAEKLVAAPQQVGEGHCPDRRRNDKSSCVPIPPSLVPRMEGLLLPRKAGSVSGGGGSCHKRSRDPPPHTPPPSNCLSLPTARAAKSCPTPAGVAESYPRGICEALTQLCSNKALLVSSTDLFFYWVCELLRLKK